MCAKKPYASREHAVYDAKAVRRKKSRREGHVTVYWCRHGCRAWHVGHVSRREWR